MADLRKEIERRRTFAIISHPDAGKTTLTAAIVRMLTAYARKVVLLAPTGRAAKVLSVNAGMPAFTIHRKIYRQKTFEGDFNLNDNLHTDTLFVADEAPMIANEGLTQSVFGSGRLLDDLVQYVYNGKGCRLMLPGPLNGVHARLRSARLRVGPQRGAPTESAVGHPLQCHRHKADDHTRRDDPAATHRLQPLHRHTGCERRRAH